MSADGPQQPQAPRPSQYSSPQYPPVAPPAPPVPPQNAQTPPYPPQGGQPGYPQGSAGYPQAPAGYPQAPTGHPAGAYAVAAPPRGLLPWALGLLILIPFPFVGGIASGIAMAVSGGASRRAGGVARENARTALNWGLTYLLVSTVLLVSHFVLLFVLSADGPITGFFPFGSIILLYVAVGILHLVLVIVGMVRASAGKVMRVPFAIPYLRA
ncbi:DUF4870 domain-containing protein [Microbacterium sp. LS_15]|uniref:DUF4870 domain-containing protein n=1 Tax=Microbacterium sp. LS_15 TaxID=3055790 RepID=UPI0031B3BE56